MIRRLATRRRIALWGTALAVASWIVHAHGVWGTSLTDRSGGLRAADYVQFYVAGSLVLSGAADRLYDGSAHRDEAHRRIGKRYDVFPPLPNYGPQVALAFVPLAALPFPLSLLAFTLLSALAYAAGVFLLLRTFPALRRDPSVVWIVALGLPAFAVTLRYGQMSTLWLLACAVSAWALSRNRELAAGTAFGVLAVKPPLLALAICSAALAGRWRFVAGASLTVAVQLGLGLLAAGTTGLRDYLGVLARLASDPDVVILFPETAHSIRGFLRLLGVPGWVASLATWCGFVFAAWSASRAWRRCATPELVLAWIVAATVLTSPHLLTYDLLLLALPMAALGAWTLEHPEHSRWPLLVVCVLLLYFTPLSVPLFAAHLRVQASTLVVLLTVLASAELCWDRSVDRRTPGTAEAREADRGMLPLGEVADPRDQPAID